MGNFDTKIAKVKTALENVFLKKTDAANTYSEKIHTHTKSQITDFPSSMTPTSHASTSTTYGAASTTNYGHAKLSTSTSSTSTSLAATPSAVKAAYDLANGKANASHTHGKADITDFPTIPSASSTTPLADTFNGSIGTGSTWAKADHTHPFSSLYADVDHNHSMHYVDFTMADMENDNLTSSPTDFINYMTSNSVSDILTEENIYLTKGDYYMVLAWSQDDQINYGTHSSNFYIYYCSYEYMEYYECELISQPYDIVDVVVTYTDSTTETLSLFKKA